MTLKPTESNTSVFESIRRVRADGNEYWSARDLQGLLGYDTWRNFTESMERARAACDNSGMDSREHFVGASKTLPQSNQHGTFERQVLDHHLTRYACYLTAMNGDPRKAEIAAAQTYFAVQTRRAEVTPAPVLALPTDPIELLELSLRGIQQTRHEVRALQATTAARTERLDNTPIAMHPEMEATIYALCQELARVIPGGYSAAYRAFKSHFGEAGLPLAKYTSLPARRYGEGCGYLRGLIAQHSRGKRLIEAGA